VKPTAPARIKASATSTRSAPLPSSSAPRPGAGTPEQELDQADDRKQSVVDLVRDARRELPERRKLATPAQLLLEVVRAPGSNDSSSPVAAVPASCSCSVDGNSRVTDGSSAARACRTPSSSDRAPRGFK
jgi:hypothetical protein